MLRAMTLQELLTGTYIFTNSYNIVNVCKNLLILPVRNIIVI